MSASEPTARDDDRAITTLHIKGGTFRLRARPEPTMQPGPGCGCVTCGVLYATKCDVCGEDRLAEEIILTMDAYRLCRPCAMEMLSTSAGCALIEETINEADARLRPAVKPEWVAPGSWATWVVVGCFCVGIPLAIWAIAAYRALGGA